MPPAPLLRHQVVQGRRAPRQVQAHLGELPELGLVPVRVQAAIVEVVLPEVKPNQLAGTRAAEAEHTVCQHDHHVCTEEGKSGQNQRPQHLNSEMFPSRFATAKEDAFEGGVPTTKLVREKAHTQHAPDSGRPMRCDSTHCIIHLQRHQKLLDKKCQKGRHAADQRRHGQRNHATARAAGHKAPDQRVRQLRDTHHGRPGAHHGEQHSSNPSASCSQESCCRGMGHHQVLAVRGGESRCRVEGEEADKQQEGAKQELHRMTTSAERDVDFLLHWILGYPVVFVIVLLSDKPGPGLPPGAVLGKAANAWPHQAGAHQSAHSAHQMHSCRACEVHKTDLCQPAITPHQACGDWVHKACHN
mmetsp:Transcript_121456/g.288626  ORF Transcript_121456/g.288626 Transcript_121456/m.288626 type:complete len:358 (-) Transcript_121456:474-1547(-)